MLEALAVAVAQFNPTRVVDDNLERMRSFAALAAERDAQLVVFPEYSQAFEPELGAWMHEVAEPIDGAFAAGVKEIAHDLDIAIVAGMLEQPASDSGEERPYNALIAVGASGELLATARKLHLYDAFGATESRWLQAGDPNAQPSVFTIDGLTFGLQTCYDVRFPEVSRRLVDAGAQALVIPAEWVRGPLKERHWQTLLRARAIENTVFVVAADHAPPIAIGHSCIIDARGIELALVGVNEGVAVAWLDAAQQLQVREVNPALQLRRFGVTPQ